MAVKTSFFDRVQSAREGWLACESSQGKLPSNTQGWDGNAFGGAALHALEKITLAPNLALIAVRDFDPAAAIFASALGGLDDDDAMQAVDWVQIGLAGIASRSGCALVQAKRGFANSIATSPNISQMAREVLIDSLSDSFDLARPDALEEKRQLLRQGLEAAIESSRIANVAPVPQSAPVKRPGI